jgi:vitamin B12 transporter
VADAGQLSVTFGARYDDNDVFGRFRTARGGFSWRVRTGLTLRASAGSAFKAPTFIEQFNTAFTIGNPALRPERSHGVETGITQIFASGRGELSGTWFSQRFRDMIQYTFIDANAPNYFNVAAASARGAEFAGRARFAGGAYLGANVVFLRTRVDDAGFDEGANATFVQGKRLLRRPSVTATLHGRVSLTPRLTADARMMHVGQRDDRDFSTFPANPVTLASYRRVDFGVTYRLTHELPALSVFVNAENVLAARYQEVMNFRAPGRVLSIGARVVTKR